MTQKITLPYLASGINILSITVDSKTYTCPVMQIGEDLYLKQSGSEAGGNFRLAKSMAPAVDTLVAKKSGYYEKKVPLSSYTLLDTTIYMDSIVPQVCNATTLKAAGACGNRNILIGTAVSTNRLNNTVSGDFNYVTPENDMKWQNVEGSENMFNFSQADAIVNWAQQNGIKVKGHCLVWHSQLAG